MPQFINSRERLVNEAIDGTLRTGGGRLARLDGYPHIRVVLRTDWDKSRVALISGAARDMNPATRALSVRVCLLRQSAATSLPRLRSMLFWPESWP